MNAVGFSTVLIGLGSSAGSCEALTTLRIPDVEILHAQPVAADSFIPDGATEPLPTPAFCRLSARAPAAVNFEVWLPADWNGKFQGVGNGGMAGSISHVALARGIHRGYAAVSTDTGHTTSDVPATYLSMRPGPAAGRI
jgi:feruloyl esterase